MKPEKRRLVHDLMSNDADGSHHQAVLLEAGKILRFRRRKRVFGQAIVACGFMAAMVLTLLWRQSASIEFVAAPPASSSSTSQKVKSLSDEELLALFPDTPVGLAKVGNKSRLIFPRPGDQERFISRL